MYSQRWRWQRKEERRKEEIDYYCGSDARKSKKEQSPAASDGGVILQCPRSIQMSIAVLLSTIIQYLDE